MSAVLTATDRTPSAPTSRPRTKPAPVFIIGVPRSGTTWLGKIFDSHPWVLYRHEPDAVIPPGFPSFCPAAEIPQHADAMRRYVAALTAVRQVKTSGTRPIFAKPYQHRPAALVRRLLAIGLRVGEAVPAAGSWAKRVPIPDLIARDAARITYVVKSVSLIGAVGLLASAVPESRIIAVFRHPCGHVASVLRGAAAGRQRGGLFGPRVLTTPRARELGMMRTDYDALPVLDRWVWAWAFAHAKLFAEVGSLPNVRLVRYESLCAAPLDEGREALAFAGLSWTRETGRFIAATTRSARRERYFGLFRDPMEAATKWRRELSADQIARITGIVEEVLPGLLSDSGAAA
jgi:hypothetical protein